MRKSISLLVLILFSVTLALAEEHDGGRGDDRDDHDDGAPIQAGYAVITPIAATTNGTTAGLVVFETFGLRHRDKGDATQAGVLPPDLTTNAILFVDSDGRLSKNLGVAIVNPNNANANVSLTLRKSDGTEVASTTLNVPSHEQVSKFVTQLFEKHSSVPRNITGTLAITSAGSSGLPVSVVGLRFRGENFSTLPVTNLSAPAGPLPSIAAGVGGAGAVLLPQFATGGGWATELVLANTSSTPMTVRVDLFKADGTALTTRLNGKRASSFTDLTIPANGVLVLAPRNKDGDDDF